MLIVTTPYLEELLAVLASLEERTRAFDLFRSDPGSHSQTLADVGASVLDLISHGLEVFEEATYLLESSDGNAGMRQESVEAASSIAFIAASGLLGHYRKLDALIKAIDDGNLPGNTELVLLSLCEETLEEAASAARALSVQLHDVLDVEPPSEGPDHSAPVIRRLTLARFWRSTSGMEAPTAETIRPRLQRAVTALARLRGDGFAYIRLSDRQVLESLQERALEWFRSGANAREGIRLWHDLSSCQVLMRQINNRAELIEHDQSVIEKILVAVAEVGCRRLAMADRLEAFSLLGRDDALDTILEGWRHGKVPDSDALIQELDRVRQTMPQSHRVEAPKGSLECRVGA
jgi:hypothetical protein